MSKVGRPSTYTQELADKICEQLAMGKSLRTVCAPDEMPNISSIFKWIKEHKEFSDQYARATEERTESQHENLLAIADEALVEVKKASEPKLSSAIVQAYKLKADNLKWSMAKMRPKKYGDKLDMTTNGKDLPTPILGGIAKTDEDKP